jgi:hypothetical protein
MLPGRRNAFSQRFLNDKQIARFYLFRVKIKSDVLLRSFSNGLTRATNPSPQRNPKRNVRIATDTHCHPQIPESVLKDAAIGGRGGLVVTHRR